MRRQNTTIDALALAAVLAQPWVDVVLSGAATPLQLESNLHAVDCRWTAELAARLDHLQEGALEYWARRSSLVWN